MEKATLTDYIKSFVTRELTAQAFGIPKSHLKRKFFLRPYIHCNNINFMLRKNVLWYALWSTEIGTDYHLFDLLNWKITDIQALLWFSNVMSCLPLIFLQFLKFSIILLARDRLCNFSNVLANNNLTFIENASAPLNVLWFDKMIALYRHHCLHTFLKLSSTITCQPDEVICTHRVCHMFSPSHVRIVTYTCQDCHIHMYLIQEKKEKKSNCSFRFTYQT